MSPEEDIMTALPKNMRMKLIPEIIENLRQFLTIKKNALAHDEQKYLSVRTTCIYPFLVMNLTSLSRQSMKHPIQHIMHLVKKLLCKTFLYFLLKYSNASLIIYMIAIMREPKAIDPI